MPTLSIGILRRADFVKTWLMNLLQSGINQNTTIIPSDSNLNVSYTEKISGTPTSSKLYEIIDNSGGANFVGSGALNNNVGTQFYANGVAPTWGTGKLAEATFPGTSIKISGDTKIDKLSQKFFNYGSRVRLVFDEACELSHNESKIDDFCGIKLIKGVSVICEEGSEVELELRNDGFWYQISGTGSFSGSSYTTIALQNLTQQITQDTQVEPGNDIVLQVDNNIAYLYYVLIRNYILNLDEVTNISGRNITVNLPFRVLSGEKFSIKYEYEGSENIIPPALLITLTNKAYTESGGNVTLSFDLISTNPNDKIINLAIELNGETRTVSIPVPAGQTVSYSLTYNGLLAATYTATITGNITDSITNIVVPALAASYVFTMLAIEKLSDTSCLAKCTAQNTGTASGETYVKVKIDSLNTVSLSPKMIGIGATETFTKQFDNLATGTHTIYFYDSNDNLIDSDTIEITAQLPVYANRSFAAYAAQGGGSLIQDSFSKIIHGTNFCTLGNPKGFYLLLVFDTSNVPAGFTSVRLVYPNYKTVTHALAAYKYNNWPFFSWAQVSANLVPANLIATGVSVSANAGPAKVDELLNFGANMLAWCTGKTTVPIILQGSDNSFADKGSIISLAELKLKFDYA